MEDKNNPFEENNLNDGNQGGADPYNEALPQNTGYDNAPSQNPQQFNSYGAPQNPQQYDGYGQQSYNGLEPADPYNATQGQYNAPQGYNNFGGYAVPVDNRNVPTGMATASMVLGIISFCLTLFIAALPPLIIAPILSLVLGIVFKTKKLPAGKGASTAGIVLSSICLFFVIIILIFIAVIALNPEIMRTGMQQIYDIDPNLYQTYKDMWYETYPQWFDGIGALFSRFF